MRNKPLAWSASIECRRHESPLEAKDERSESFARGARGFAKENRNKPQARSASIEHRRHESLPEAKDEQRESFAGGARGFAKHLLSPLHHEGANTIFLTNKKLSLDKRLTLGQHSVHTWLVHTRNSVQYRVPICQWSIHINPPVRPNTYTKIKGEFPSPQDWGTRGTQLRALKSLDSHLVWNRGVRIPGLTFGLEQGRQNRYGRCGFGHTTFQHKKTKKTKKNEIRTHLQDWRIGKLNNFLVNITQPIL